MPPSNDADDVLDFINSLPDSKSGTPKPSAATTSGSTEKKEDKEDFLEFLDELAAHEKKKPSTPKPAGASAKAKSSFEPKKERATPSASGSPASTVPATAPSGESSSAAAETSVAPQEDNEIDPIGSISSWWNTEGSTKVSSLWGSITSNAQQISDQTYQLASTTSNQLSQQRQKILKENKFNTDQITQLDYLGDRLNSVLTTMSQQITQGLIGPDDELLNILLIHDLDNINYLDKECSNKFNKVMNQVEGGIRVTVNNFNHKQPQEDDTLEAQPTNLNLFYGKIIDGEKLCFANLESSIKDYQSYNLIDEKVKEKSGEEQEKKETTTEEAAGQEEAKESEESQQPADEINKSNIFISIQSITSRTSNEDTSSTADADAPILIESNNHDSFSFTLILKDITNNITIITKTQPFPLQWAHWLNGESKVADENINPSDWVKDWIKEGLSLSFGVLAQNYVVKRMGY